MKVSFISSTISRNGGGVFEIERKLAQHLFQIDQNTIHVLGLRDEFADEDLHYWQPIQPTVFSVVGPKAFGYAPDMFRELKKIDPDIIHINSLWTYTSVITQRWHTATKKPFVITPNGMLDRWALNNSRWKKQIAACLYEQRNLKKAACIIANSFKELEAIRKLGLKNPVAIIPNGVDLPVIEDKNKAIDDRKKLLYLGRIHPKKGLENLIKGWTEAKMGGDHQWDLHIVGWGAEKDIVQLEEQIRNMPSIHYHGPKFGTEKESFFKDSDAFILPSFSEGMPMAILEAWSYGLPVLITPECNLEIGFQKEAAIKIQTDVKSIKQALESLFSMDMETLQDIGSNGRKVVEQEFSWVKAANQLQEVYKWLIKKHQEPDFIY